MVQEEEYTVVLRTGKIFEFQMAVDVLDHARLPFFKRQEFSSGLQLAMPLVPSMGPGVWYILIVPTPFASVARKKLEKLPFVIKTDPSVWDFSPKKKYKTKWVWYLRILLVIWLCAVAFMLGGFLRSFR